MEEAKGTGKVYHLWIYVTSQVLLVLDHGIQVSMYIVIAIR
jgi:hypothetical protein